MSVAAAEFLKWCEVFGIVTGGGGGPITYPLSMGLGGTGASLAPSNNALFYSTASNGALLPTALNAILITDVNGNLEWNVTLPPTTLCVSPSIDQQVANKGYVDAAVAGLNPSQPVYAASTTNLTGYTYNNGAAGVGATLTAPSFGAFIMDGVTVPMDQPVLYKNDTTGSGDYNGVYTLTTAGDVGTAAVLTRATYYDTPTQINSSGVIPVSNGLNNEGTGWLLVSPVTTIGTDPLDYIQFGQPSGVVPLARGGSNADLTAVAGGVVYSGASSWAITAVGSSGQILSSAGSGAPIWTTATYPITTTINQILYSSANNVIGQISSVNSAVMITSAGGIPSFSTTLPAGLTIPGYQPSVSAAALTEVDDTNVTLTLGGTPATALLQAVSITAGWTGQLSLTRGGSNASLTASNGGIVYSTASAMAILGGTPTEGQLLTSGANTTPAWSTSTYPLTNAINTLLYASSANTMAALATANSAVLVTSAGGVPSLSTTLPAGLNIPGYQPSISPAALTKTDDTNITLTLGGTPATSLLQAVSITAGWTGLLSLARGGSNANLTASAGSVVYSTASAFAFTGVGNSGQLLASAGTGTPVWTTNTFPNTDVKGDILYASATNTISGLGIGGTGTILTVVAGLPAWTTATYPATTTINQVLYSSVNNQVTGITAVNSAVMISSAGGVPSFSTTLPAGLTIPGYQTSITPSALTESNDTNVTLTLGGTPATALLQAVSITAGWTGQLSLTRGGSNASLTASNGGIVYSTASAMAILAGTATAGQLLTSGANTTPAWSTSTYPLTNAANTLLYASSANTMAALATANDGVLITSNSGVPSWLANSGTAGFVLTANTGAPPSWQNITAVYKAPTVQKFTSGSGTYTTPTSPSPLYIRVVAQGGGGGGQGSGGGGFGGNGGNTTFGTTLIFANGASGATGGSTASLGAAIGVALLGAAGAPGTGIVNSSGGEGAASPFGGSGSGSPVGGGAGGNAVANTGAGGGGGPGTAGTGGAYGGGAGAYVDGIITSPGATYSYAVGAAGTGGTAGTGSAGGNGGSGAIYVWEYYQ